jgi:hypothetical protein
MALILRVLAPNFDPGATVETVGVTPRPAPEEDVAELDDQLVELLHPESADEEESSSTPPVPEGVVTQSHS